MRALILAAGRGERMRPLTLRTPKPLLRAGGMTLIEWHIAALARAGIVDLVVNTAHLASQFPAALGDGSRHGVSIRYSHEGDEPLETGGGMRHALELLGEEPFVAVNGDIWTDFDFATLPRAPTGLAHLVLVANPPQHPRGDFSLADDGRIGEHEPRLTFAGIGVYRPALVAAQPRGSTFRLAPLLYEAARAGFVSGQRYDGKWTDVGTPERLAALDSELSSGRR